MRKPNEQNRAAQGRRQQRVVRLPASAIENIIKQEIRWHKSRRGQSGHGADWEIGFIEGLYQCLKVTQEAMSHINDKS